MKAFHVVQSTGLPVLRINITQTELSRKMIISSVKDMIRYVAAFVFSLSWEIHQYLLEQLFLLPQD